MFWPAEHRPGSSTSLTKSWLQQCQIREHIDHSLWYSLFMVFFSKPFHICNLFIPLTCSCSDIIGFSWDYLAIIGFFLFSLVFRLNDNLHQPMFISAFMMYSSFASQYFEKHIIEWSIFVVDHFIFCCFVLPMYSSSSQIIVSIHCEWPLNWMAKL
jgi:hypothetical protein